MMSKRILVAFLLLNVALALTHKCVHNTLEKPKIMKTKNPLDNYPDLEKDENGNRRFRNLSPRPMRITFDTSRIEGLPVYQKNFIKEQLIAARKFFSSVLSLETPLEWTSGLYPGQTSCLSDVTWNDGDIPSEFPDSDLHIFVAYIEDNESSTIAYASSCSYSGYDNRPLVGTIVFNLAYAPEQSEMTPIVYRSVQYVVLHELTHVLVFSSALYDLFIDTSIVADTPQVYAQIDDLIEYDINDDPIGFKGPNVLAFAREYFACNTLEYVPIENGGSEGSAGSHWEINTISNEFMVSALGIQQMAISPFTLNMLKDSGWYTVNLDLADPVFWGKGQGCHFVEQACDSVTSYDEFQPESMFDQCTFDSDSIGVSSSDGIFSGTCAYVYPIYTCYGSPEENADITDWDGDATQSGLQSRCVESDLVVSGESSFLNSRCLQSKCTPNQNGADSYEVTFYIWRQPDTQQTVTSPTTATYSGASYTTTSERVEVVCSTESEVIDIDVTFDCAAGDNSCQSQQYTGSITCPSDFSRFCNRQGLCPRFCSMHGFCVNRQCYCVDGLFGIDCSQGTIDLTGDGSGDSTDDTKEVYGQILLNSIAQIAVAVIVLLGVATI